MASSSPPKYASVVGSQFDLTQPVYEDVVIIRDDESSSSSTPDSADSLLQSERAPLLSSPTPAASYGATPISYELSPAATRRILFNAAMKMAALFIVSTIVLGGTLWLALPTLEEYVAICSPQVSLNLTISKGKTDPAFEYQRRLPSCRTSTSF